MKKLLVLLFLLFISCNNNKDFPISKIDFNDSIQKRNWIKKHNNNNFVRYDFIITTDDKVVIINNINKTDKNLKCKDEIIKDLYCELLISDSLVANLVKNLQKCQEESNLYYNIEQ